MFDIVEKRFREVAPAASECEFCSLRVVEEQHEQLQIRRDVLDPVHERTDVGLMLTVFHRGGHGYAATSDLSKSGIRSAIERARYWADRTRRASIFAQGTPELPQPKGHYSSLLEQPWRTVALSDKIALLRDCSERLAGDDPIVDYKAALWWASYKTLFVTSGGARFTQDIELLFPDLSVTANRGADSQTRSLGVYGECQQGGLEMLGRIGFHERGTQLKEQALALLDAPDCPSESTDVVLMPDQMMLQIHESIGHPLELDRILGDERNYAGTSFVNLDMFGSYRYGSELLNVSFDPTRQGEVASYGYDDEGSAADKIMIIEQGILKRPLGGAVSQARAGRSGTANARAEGWQRPAIDRMANLNLEPGAQSLEQMIASIERGVLMQTNASWSIDDSRNKFQFGCELGRMIEDGELKGLVKNPNYRGVSATFWRSLAGVGGEEEVQLLGTPFCGKGEPNQAIRVGHASPPCWFKNVDVFGGAG